MNDNTGSDACAQPVPSRSTTDVANDAFAVVQALHRATHADPELVDNPAWRFIYKVAHLAFEQAFEAVP